MEKKKGEKKEIKKIKRKKKKEPAGKEGFPGSMAVEDADSPGPIVSGSLGAACALCFQTC